MNVIVLIFFTGFLQQLYEVWKFTQIIKYCEHCTELAHHMLHRIESVSNEIYTMREDFNYLQS